MCWLRRKSRGGLAFLTSTLAVRSQLKNCLVKPQGEFLLCSRPTEASGCTGGLQDLDGFMEICMRYLILQFRKKTEHSRSKSLHF